MNDDKLKLALGLLSGRIEIDNLSSDEWLLLGYEPTWRYGRPKDRSVLGTAEDIIFEALTQNEQVGSRSS